MKQQLMALSVWEYYVELWESLINRVFSLFSTKKDLPKIGEEAKLNNTFQLLLTGIKNQGYLQTS